MVFIEVKKKAGELPNGKGKYVFKILISEDDLKAQALWHAKFELLDKTGNIIAEDYHFNITEDSFNKAKKAAIAICDDFHYEPEIIQFYLNTICRTSE